MKNLDCNQINILINLEIIGEEKLYIYIYIYILKIYKKILQFGEATWRNRLKKNY